MVFMRSRKNCSKEGPPGTMQVSLLAVMYMQMLREHRKKIKHVIFNKCAISLIKSHHLYAFFKFNTPTKKKSIHILNENVFVCNAEIEFEFVFT